jgi:lysophospholipase L1-like esterase
MSRPASIENYYATRAIDALDSDLYAWDLCESSQQANWRQRNSKCSFQFTTTSSSFVIEHCGNASGFPGQAGIDVFVDGGLNTTIAQGADNTVVYTTVSGLGTSLKTLRVVESAQYGGEATTGHGHFVRSIYVPNGSTLVKLLPTEGDNVLEAVGDSILDGFSVEPESQGSMGLLRVSFPGRVVCNTRGNRSLYGATNGGLDTDTFATAIVTGLGSARAGRKRAVLFQLAFNDYYGADGSGIANWRAAVEFKNALAAVVDRIHQLAPDVQIFLQTATLWGSEASTNRHNETLASARSAYVSVAATRSFCTIIDGTAIMTAGNTSDGIHPNATGHGQIRTGVETVIRAYYGY